MKGQMKHIGIYAMKFPFYKEVLPRFFLVAGASAWMPTATMHSIARNELQSMPDASMVFNKHSGL